MSTMVGVRSRRSERNRIALGVIIYFDSQLHRPAQPPPQSAKNAFLKVLPDDSMIPDKVLLVEALGDRDKIPR